MKNQVRIIPNYKGELIHVYVDFKEFGYITLLSDEVAREDIYNKLYQQRKFIFDDRLEVLNELIDNIAEDNIIPGRLVVNEFRENEIPVEFLKRLNKNKPYEDSIKPFIKDFDFGITPSNYYYNNKNYPKNKGQRIIRFVSYDSTGEEKDVILPIDDIPLPIFTPLNYVDNMSNKSNKVSNTKISSILKEKSLVNTAEKLINIDSNTDSIKVQETKTQTNTHTKHNNNNNNGSIKVRNESWIEKLLNTIFIPLIVIFYIAYVIIKNDKIARMEGSSLWEQLMLLFAAIGVYAIFRSIKKSD